MNQNPNEPQAKTQVQMIIKHLEKQPITAYEALKLYGCFRLAARIADIKNMGYDIETKMIVVSHSNKKVAQYSIIKH